MKKYEVTVEDENAAALTELLQSLTYVKEIKQSDMVDPYTLASEKSLAEDWLLQEDEELQSLYKNLAIKEAI